MALCLFALSAMAGTVRSGGYVVRYAVINSLQIPASVARANDITRRGDRAVVSVTLQHPSPDTPFKAVPARVSGKARTLLGEHFTLDFRRVQAADSIYSLATIPLDETKQTLTLSLEVASTDGDILIPLEFTQTLLRRTRTHTDRAR